MNVSTDGGEGFRTGLAQSVLQEIAERLAFLAETGRPAVIDLRSLPMTPADRSELEETLGHGEIEVALSVAGMSQVWETRYAGVWWVRHFGDRDRIAAERIEITPFPDILVTDDADIAAASGRLREDLASEGFAGENAAHV